MVGKAKWKPLVLSQPRKSSSSNVESHFGGTAEISVIIKNLKDAGVVVLTTWSFKYPLWPVKRTDGSRGLINDNQKLNEAVAPISAAVSGVVLT